MVPETAAGADHNWPERMTMTTTNVEILRQGWLDAASALAPDLESLPELLEKGLDAAVMDERLDEQSLLRVVTDVASAAADSLPAEELYFLTRRLQRAVYEYLLSLDALPEPPARRDSGNGHAVADTSLIGAEEVAAMGRSSTPKVAPAPTPAAEAAPDSTAIEALESAVTEIVTPEAAAPAAETADAPAADVAEVAAAEPEPVAEAEPVVAPEPVATSRPAAEVPVIEPEPAAAEEAPQAAVTRPAPEHPTRPAFTLFRRTTTTHTAQPAESNGYTAEETAATTEVAAPTEAAATAPAEPESTHTDDEASTGEPFVAPRDGFHLSDLTDFNVVERPAEAVTPVEIPESPGPAPAPAPAPEPDTPLATARTESDPTGTAAGAPSPQRSRGWRLRDHDAEEELDTEAESITEDSRFETDPEVVEARLEINDRLRRRRCDEAAALLQRLASDVGGRALADLALDAGDRCRALGKGNAALSCYLAASRADPVHETPLLRLADICIDDHDIDLAVSYLERVTRLRRLRNDDKGALKLYRKIVTIAPYRDDILAMLMRAQANGRFDE